MDASGVTRFASSAMSRSISSISPNPTLLLNCTAMYSSSSRFTRRFRSTLSAMLRGASSFRIRTETCTSSIAPDIARATIGMSIGTAPVVCDDEEEDTATASTA
jgi:hypothetical protein